MINCVNNFNNQYNQKPAFGNAIKLVQLTTKASYASYVQWFHNNYNVVPTRKNWILNKFEKIKYRIASYLYGKLMSEICVLSNPDYKSYAILQGKKIIGGMSFHKSELGNCAVCDAMFIDKKHQRTKDGLRALRMLIENLIAQCEEMKLNRIEWETDNLHKNAMNLYNKLTKPCSNNGKRFRFSVYIDELKSYLKKRSKRFIDKQ